MKFDISGKNLTTLEGINFPDGITELDCSNNSLTSLQYCPNSVIHLICNNNPLSSEYLYKTIYEIHKINTLKSYKLGIHKLNSMISSVKIQRTWKFSLLRLNFRNFNSSTCGRVEIFGKSIGMINWMTMESIVIANLLWIKLSDMVYLCKY